MKLERKIVYEYAKTRKEKITVSCSQICSQHSNSMKIGTKTLRTKNY